MDKETVWEVFPELSHSSRKPATISLTNTSTSSTTHYIQHFPRYPYHHLPCSSPNHQLHQYNHLPQHRQINSNHPLNHPHNHLFFSIWVFFNNHLRITGLQGKGESVSLAPHHHLDPLRRRLGIGQMVPAEG